MNKLLQSLQKIKNVPTPRLVTLKQSICTQRCENGFLKIKNEKFSKRLSHAHRSFAYPGESIPGLTWMAGSHKTTLVFTLFILPPLWAPWILFQVMWAKYE